MADVRPPATYGADRIFTSAAFAFSRVAVKIMHLITSHLVAEWIRQMAIGHQNLHVAE